jgi:ParB-like chromosome segregation protein Spo0J
MSKTKVAVVGSTLPSVAAKIAVAAIDVVRNSRRHFDEAALKDLGESIKARGNFQSIVVRKVGARYQLVAGERRLRAAKLVGVKDLNALVYELTDEQFSEFQAAENLQREDLRPIEEAQALRSLFDQAVTRAWKAKYPNAQRVPENTGLEHLGKKQLPGEVFKAATLEVAARAGKPHAHVVRALRLLELPAAIQALIDSGELLIEHGLLMLTIPQERWPELTQDLKNVTKDNKMGMSGMDRTETIENIYAIIEQRGCRSLDRAPFPTNVPFAGTVACSACPFNTAVQGSLIPGIDEKGNCQESKCWMKKREEVYRLIRDERQKQPENKDLKFAGFGRKEYGGGTPETVRGCQVIKAGTPAAAQAKVLMADPKKREAVGWALVKPQQDSAKPDVSRVLVIRDPKAFAGTKGVSQSKGENASSRERGPDIKGEFVRTVGNSLDRLNLVHHAKTNGKRKFTLLQVLGFLTDLSDIARAAHHLGYIEKAHQDGLKKLTDDQLLYAAAVDKAMDSGWEAKKVFGIEPSSLRDIKALDRAYEANKKLVKVTSWGSADMDYKDGNAIAADIFAGKYAKDVAPEKPKAADKGSKPEAAKAKAAA